MTVPLRKALDDFALLAVEGQDTLANQPGIDGPWEVDLEAGWLRIGQVTFEVALIGSSSSRDNSWMWGWCNRAFGPQHPAVAPILVGRETARRVGVAEFALETFSLNGLSDYGMHPGSGVAFMAARLSGLTAIYCGPYDGGVAYFGIRGLELPPPDPVAFPRLAGMAGAFSEDHRQTIGQYGRMRGLNPTVPPEGGITLNYPGGSRLTCSFDGWNRLTRITGNVSAPPQ